MENDKNEDFDDSDDDEVAFEGDYDVSRMMMLMMIIRMRVWMRK